MKKLRYFCMACVFALALATATFAGDIATPGKTDPPPPPSNQSSAQTPEDIHTGGGKQNSTATSGTVADTVADIALSLLQTMFWRL